jgi:moderate conductance mechanosensitive channel
MPTVRSLFEEVSVLAARTLSLGDAAAHMLARVVAILGALLLGWLGYRMVALVIRRALRPLVGSTDYPVRAQRARTLGPMLTSVARYIIAFVVAVVILQQIGIDVGGLLLSAGVAGIVLGLGAQSLIRDVIMGFFILFENLIVVGDVIEVGQHTGVVESVGLRITKIRKFSGELRIVPNGDLSAFGHHTAGWGRLVVEIAVDYEEDVDRALRVLGEVGKALAAARPETILEPPTAEGILRFGQVGSTEMVLRLYARVVAMEKVPLEFEARRRAREAFAAHGIRAPRVAMDVRVTPSPGSGSAGDVRKESVA